MQYSCLILESEIPFTTVLWNTVKHWEYYHIMSDNLCWNKILGKNRCGLGSFLVNALRV